VCDCDCVLTGPARPAGAPEQAEPISVKLQHRRLAVKLYRRQLRDRHGCRRLLDHSLFPSPPGGVNSGRSSPSCSCCCSRWWLLSVCAAFLVSLFFACWPLCACCLQSLSTKTVFFRPRVYTQLNACWCPCYVIDSVYTFTVYRICLYLSNSGDKSCCMTNYICVISVATFIC